MKRQPAINDLRDMLRSGQPRQAASTVGLLSRLAVTSMLELLPSRMSEFNRFYQDVIVRQIAYGAAPDRGRTLLELLELLDSLILPEAIDEIGMSQDRSASSSLIAIESLGRLREVEAVPVLRAIVEDKRLFGYTQHRELRIAAIQALSKIDPRYADQIFEGISHPSSTRRFGGLGIRLNLVKEIVTHHKGKIWLESKTGQGANFHFTLPTPKS